MTIKLRVNGHDHELDVDPEMPLLWALRDVLGLTGTKYGCGHALCGSCVVHVAGEASRSGVTPVRLAAGKEVTTIGARFGGARALQCLRASCSSPPCASS